MEEKHTCVFSARDYSEEMPHRLRRIIWRIINEFVFYVIPMSWRKKLVRYFGVKGRFACHLYPSVKIYAPWNLELDKWVCLGPNVELYNKGQIKIGHDVVISQGAYLCTASHDISSPVMTLVTKPIVVESYSWIAAKAIILPGVTIGEGAVVGAGSVVSKDVPPWTVVAGNPAKIIKKRILRQHGN